MGLNKHYHSSPRSNPAIRSIELLNNEKSICRLVQRTIIPLNIVTPKPAILDIPCTSSMGKLDYLVPEKIDREPEKMIIDPTKHEEKSAHRMLIIRRRKMNRHKRLKRMRKNKFAIAKRHREKRMKKEVVFRQEIAAKLREVEKFNAEEYVAEKLAMYRKEILPARMHGKIMPALVIEDYVERMKFRKNYIQGILDRKRKFKEKRGGTLDVDIKS